MGWFRRKLKLALPDKVTKDIIKSLRDSPKEWRYSDGSLSHKYGFLLYVRKGIGKLSVHVCPNTFLAGFKDNFHIPVGDKDLLWQAIELWFCVGREIDDELTELKLRVDALESKLPKPRKKKQ